MKKKILGPIPETVVASYIIDIIRRVFSNDWFGCNNLRKKFFSVIIKILNGLKGETFLWETLLDFFFYQKHKLIWCDQMSSDKVKNLMILNSFKFFIIHYLFIILKSSFYITETGSSKYKFQYYKKNDMERVSGLFVNNLLFYKKIKSYKRHYSDCFTMERCWVDTGVINEYEIRRNCKTYMNAANEYIQPVAKARFLPKHDFLDEIRLITNIPRRKCKLNPSSSDCSKLSEVFERRLGRRETKLFYLKLLLEFLINKFEVGNKCVPKAAKVQNLWERVVFMKKNFSKFWFFLK